MRPEMSTTTTKSGQAIVSTPRKSDMVASDALEPRRISSYIMPQRFQPTRAQTTRPPMGSDRLLVKKSKRSKKVRLKRGL